MQVYRSFLYMLVTAFAVGSAIGASPGVSIADSRIVEGDVGQRSLEIAVTITPPATGPVTVNYASRNGTAVSGSDLTPASGTINFAKDDVIKKITIAINGDKIPEADEKFEMVLSDPKGAALTKSIGSIIIVDDDFVPGQARGPSVYEVRLTYTGYTGSLAGAEDCPVRRNGKFVLTGLLSGDERGAGADDIVYRGVLQMESDIDMCEVVGAEDKARSCFIRVIGSGAVSAELTMRFDDRGGYIKTRATPEVIAILSGSCDAATIADERAQFPDRSMASMFNGVDLPMPTTKLRVGRYNESDSVGELVVEVLRVVRP